MTEGRSLTNYDEAYAKAAQQYAEEEQSPGGQFIKTRGGILSYGDIEMPGQQMCVVILDSVRENTYYAEKWSEDAPAAPRCYAFAKGNDEMGPHESMQKHPEVFEPQHDGCDGCPMNEWGSADTGRGKACQNRRRLAVIPAGMYIPKKGSRDFDLDLFDDEKHYKDADMAFLKLPPTSVKFWAKYVQQVSAAHRRPPYGVITRVYTQPDSKDQYHVKFEMLETLPDALAGIIMARHEEAAANIITPYSPPQERDEPAPARGVRGLRR